MLFSTEREIASHPFGAAPMVSLTLVVCVCRSPVIIYAIGRACFGDCDILVRCSKGFFYHVVVFVVVGVCFAVGN